MSSIDAALLNAGRDIPYSRSRVAAAFFFPALGGLLFGYDIGATAYVLPQLMSKHWSGVSWRDAVADNTVVQGTITSAGVGGALIGSVVVFRVTDRLGTRREMIVAAVLFAAGAVVEAVSGEPSWDAAVAKMPSWCRVPLPPGVLYPSMNPYAMGARPDRERPPRAGRWRQTRARWWTSWTCD